MRVLVAEDERHTADALREDLEAQQYEVVVERTGEAAYLRIGTDAFDLILLDLLQPGREGLQVLSAIRQRGCTTPVLVLTARDATADRVASLDAGADDYLVKPFAFAELLARMRALLRRRSQPRGVRLIVGPLSMDVATRNVTCGGQLLDLTPREFELLEYLMRNEGLIVSRDAVIHDVWKEPARNSPLDNVIDVHVARLRRKVEAGGPMRMIHTVRGVGFLLCKES